jgi:FKBP-type peptidyl-prolyl cis-trans isomerase SlyD
MTITNDSAVEIHFTITDKNGQTLDSTRDHHPAAFLYGQNQMLPGVEKALDGKSAGDKVTADLKADDAFGPRNEQLIQQTTIDQFGDQSQVKEGVRFETRTEEGGVMIATIVKVEGPSVTLDMNHPLAGEDLIFDIEVISVRLATADELSHGHMHGPGCDH